MRCATASPTCRSASLASNGNTARARSPATLAIVPSVALSCCTPSPACAGAAACSSCTARLALPRKWVRATISWPG
ncbi:hypothetical protein G6F53_014231 [Rhizopus delemar]|nr:hypothetical protein G6F53_014231 [Rhizopus delemar]